MIPPRICITFRRAPFWSRLKSSEVRILDDRAENTINTLSGSHVNFSGNHKFHENRSELDPYSTNRAENQGFCISKVPRSQRDPSGTPKLPYKIKNRLKNPKTQPTRLSTKFGHQPYVQSNSPDFEHSKPSWTGCPSMNTLGNQFVLRPSCLRCFRRPAVHSHCQ